MNNNFTILILIVAGHVSVFELPQESRYSLPSIYAPSIYAHPLYMHTKSYSQAQELVNICTPSIFCIARFCPLPVIWNPPSLYARPVIFMWFCTTNDNSHYTRCLNNVKIWALIYQKGGYRMMTIIEKFGCKDLGGFLTAMTPLRTTPQIGTRWHLLDYPSCTIVTNDQHKCLGSDLHGNDPLLLNLKLL